MVKSVINAVYSEVRGLHQAAYVLGIFTLGSQVLALVRDRMLAHQFGAGVELDLYYTAFRIPDFLYVLFASTLSVYVLIPFVAERMAGKGAVSARKLLSDILTIFVVFYTVFALCIIAGAPTIVRLFFPGFGEQADTLVLLMQILMVQPLLLGLSSLLGVITQFGHRFMLYAVSPLLYNIGIILGLVFLYPRFGIEGLVWGVVIGALAHLLIQAPFVLRHELAPRFSMNVDWSDVGTVLRVSVPRALTLALHQFVLLGFVGFASIMSVGSVSVFQFAFNLQSVPLAIVGVSYSVAAFPILARLHAEKQLADFSKLIMNALRHIIFWSFPIIALLIVVRAQFVRVILGTGAFDWSDTRLTAAILALFALSLAAQAIHLLLVRALYATQNTKLPFYVTLFSSVFAIISAFVFYLLILAYEPFRELLQLLMRLENVEGIEVLALPLGYSCALIIETLLLLFLSKVQLLINMRLLLLATLRGAVAALTAGFCAYTTLNFYATGVETDTLVTIFFQGFCGAVAGALGALIVYYLMKSPELSEAYQALHKRLFKTPTIVGPQDEDALSL
jgi:putative peptidoglycan lipid II flippase